MIRRESVPTVRLLFLLLRQAGSLPGRSHRFTDFPQARAWDEKSEKGGLLGHPKAGWPLDDRKLAPVNGRVQQKFIDFWRAG